MVLKLVVSLGSLLIIYTIASDLYKIAYLEFKGVETTGKLITLMKRLIREDLNQNHILQL